MGPVIAIGGIDLFQGFSMSKSVSSQTGSPPDHSARKLTFAALFTAVAGIILVDAEILAVAGAAIYSFGSALGAGTIGVSIIGAVIGLPTLWLCWTVARMALAGEGDIMDQ